MTSINTEFFCKKVAEKCMSEGHSIIPEQIRLALGGISNLYFETCLKCNAPSMDFLTKDFFISDIVALNTILQEVENCAGTNREDSTLILDKMKSVLYDFLVTNPRRSERIEFKPLGMFQINELASMSFRFTYKDPSSDYYNSYLLSK